MVRVVIECCWSVLFIEICYLFGCVGGGLWACWWLVWDYTRVVREASRKKVKIVQNLNNKNLTVYDQCFVAVHWEYTNNGSWVQMNIDAYSHFSYKLTWKFLVKWQNKSCMRLSHYETDLYNQLNFLTDHFKIISVHLNVISKTPLQVISDHLDCEYTLNIPNRDGFMWNHVKWEFFENFWVIKFKFCRHNFFTWMVGSTFSNVLSKIRHWLFMLY